MNRPDYSHLKVLFVDDEEMARKYFSRALADDLEVLTARNVAEGQALLAEHADHIAVLVTDQRMPGGNGVQLLKHAREQYPQIVRLLTTAYSDLNEAIEAVNRGEIFRYLTKPWDIDQLQSEIGHAMELFWLRRERELLVAEKLAARSRLLHFNRARDLLVMAAGISHTRSAVAAMASFLKTAAAQRQSWVAQSSSDPAAEIQNSLNLGRRIIAATRGGTGADEALDLAVVAKSIADLPNPIRVQDPVPLLGDRVLLGRLLGLLAGQGPTLVIAGATGGAELTVYPPQPWPALAAFYGSTEPASSATEARADRLAELLAAHLICYHHGGSVTLGRAVDGRQLLRLLLPASPDVAAAPAPYWLEDLLAGFESAE